MDNQVLYKNIIKCFNQDELENLCFELNINSEEIAGETLSTRVRELVNYCDRHGKLDSLVILCEKKRPHIKWKNEITGTTQSNTSITPPFDNSSLYSLNLKYDSDGELLIEETELLAVAGDVLFEIEKNNKIKCTIIHTELPKFNEFFDLPPEKLNDVQRTFRPTLWRYKKSLENNLDLIEKAIEIILKNLYQFKIYSAYSLSLIFRGLGRRLARTTPNPRTRETVGFALYLKDDPTINCVIHVNRDQVEGKIYYRINLPGWKLYELPNDSIFESAIPAIVLEYLYLQEKDDIAIEKFLSLNSWEMGLN